MRVFVGSVRVEAIPATDRGLAYGDGLFETMRAHDGAVPWWDAHWARLASGAARLRLALPGRDLVREHATQLLAGRSMVLKLLVSRGSGGRGYGPPVAPVPTWVLSVHPLPPAAPAHGLALRWCETRLASQPRLAGLKHCNRLEQVLARAEWRPRDRFDEGLMLGNDGDVVSAIAANVFLRVDGGWVTPPVDRCGVAGVCRQWVLEHFDVVQRRVAPVEVESARSLVLTNAVRGILPVSRLGERALPANPEVEAWQRRLASAHPGFSVSAKEVQ